jgi:hypothetical protein
MAFTETQKVAIRGYLGFSLGHYQYNTVFESMLDKIGGVSVEQTAVEAILTELATIDAVVAASGSRGVGTGALKKVDEVEFYSPKDSSGQTTAVDAVRRGRILINRLASRFGFTRAELPSDYFGTGGPSGMQLGMG